MDLLVLSGDDVRALLEPDQLLDRLAQAFIAFSSGKASAPPRIAAMTPAGLLAAMPSYVPGMALEVKLVSVFAANADLGLPSHQALIAIFDEATGVPVALMDGTTITAVRTATASALATRTVGRRDAGVLAILGAGVQGRAHLDALARVVEPEEIRVASRNPAHAAALAGEHDRARPVTSFEEAVRDADVVCCCTDSAVPILRRDWLRSGAHVNSVGGTGGPELDATTIATSRLFVESRAAFLAPPAGCHELQGLDPQSATELGEVLAGTAPGRRDDSELTVYKSMGHAVEDAAAASLVLEAARARGMGTAVTI